MKLPSWLSLGSGPQLQHYDNQESITQQTHCHNGEIMYGIAVTLSNIAINTTSVRFYTEIAHINSQKKNHTQNPKADSSARCEILMVVTTKTAIFWYGM
jgi:hypothetical protein